MLINELSKYPVGGIPTSAGALFRLTLRYPSITKQGVKSLLAQSSAISEFFLTSCDVDDVLLPITEAIQTNTSLTKLNLSDMLYYTEQNGSALSKMLQINKSLTHLDLSMNRLSDSGARCIFDGLQHNIALVNLNLRECGITATDPDTARSLTDMLQVNKSLKHLDLSKNRLSDSGTHCIFEGLQNNTTLVYLNLSDTRIAVSRSLTKMLKVNKSLTHLDLSWNRLSDSGARCIFEGLEDNTTLVNLNLSHTDTVIKNTDTVSAIIKILQANKSLTHLDLSNHFSYSHQMIPCIFEGLKHNSTLRYLDLHAVTGITDIHAEHIAQTLQSNCTLQTLDVSQCSFLSHNGIDIILQSLMFNSTLQILYISNIDSETLSAFKREREAKNLPPIDIVLSYLGSDLFFV